MAINLSKEQSKEPHKAVNFTDEDFANIDIKNIMENKRIFIPYDKLPDDKEMRCSYLESLLSLIERKTGKHCSYFTVNEFEPYEVNGVYIQTAPELRDRSGKYVNNNDFVYDKDGVKWQVCYYYKNNQIRILIDNDTFGYAVISNLSEFALNPDDDFKEAVEQSLRSLLEEENKKDNDVKSFNIGAVAASVILGLMVILLSAYVVTQLPEAIEELFSNMPKESANTRTDDESAFVNALRNMASEIKDFGLKLLLIPMAIIPISVAIRVVKELFRRY